MNDTQISILIKAWETYQNLSKGFGDNCWKIRATGVAFWAAVIAYGYQHNDFKVYLFSVIFIVFFFILEAGMRVFQNKYIAMSTEIEKTINDILVEESAPRVPDKGISTNFSVPSFRDFINLLHVKRWGFWSPYLLVIVISILLYTFKIETIADSNVFLFHI